MFSVLTNKLSMLHSNRMVKRSNTNVLREILKEG